MSKFSYADIVKGLNKPIEQNDIIVQNDKTTVKDQNIKPLYSQNKISKVSVNINGSFNNRITVLLNKIFKSEKNNKFYAKALNEIKNIIINCNITFDSVINSMMEINNILIRYKFRKLIDINKNNPNHEYVATNISDIIKKINKTEKEYSNYKIVDIGGGEGDVIKYIGQSLNIPSENLYCVEQESWSEKYNFINNVNYVFWDNVDINLPNEDIDLFLLMVSMHHMTNSTIDNALLNMSKQIKKNGIVIIKENKRRNY